MYRAAIFVIAVFLAAAADADSFFHIRHVARVTDLPADRAVQVWVPLPVSTPVQTIENLTLHSDVDWDVVTDPEYGNTYAYATVSGRREVVLEIGFDASRRDVLFGAWPDSAIADGSRARALRPDALVTISPRIREIAQRLIKNDATTLAKARSIYDYVLAAMRYDKAVPGWGNGDTERACDVGAGNCTDFHSLFLSLARAAGIPARFVMGLPLSGEGGSVAGYHCWAEFYAEGCGWVPVDISDASKAADPARRELLFGNLDADRIQITTGRDVRLPLAAGAPRNYSFHPHAEVAGETVGCASLEVSYRRLRADGPRT